MALVLAMLATYRLSTDLAWESGPCALYARLRGWVMARAGAEHWLSEGVSCPVCWSFWLAIPFALAVAPLDGTLLLYWLGIAGAVALVVRGTTDE